MHNRMLRRLVPVTAALIMLIAGGGHANAAIVIGNQSESKSASPCNGTFSLTEGPAQQTNLPGPNPKVNTLTARIDVWCYIVSLPWGTYGTGYVTGRATITGPLLMGKDCTNWNGFSTSGWFNGYVGSISCSVDLSGPADVGAFTADQYFHYDVTPATGAVLSPGCSVRSSGWSPYTQCDSVLTTHVLPPS